MYKRSLFWDPVDMKGGPYLMLIRRFFGIFDVPPAARLGGDSPPPYILFRNMFEVILALLPFKYLMSNFHFDDFLLFSCAHTEKLKVYILNFEFFLFQETSRRIFCFGKYIYGKYFQRKEIIENS